MSKPSTLSNPSPNTLHLPPSSATPTEIQHFLTHLLLTRHNLPQNQADQIASRWTLGSGRELYTYSPAVYINVFGPEEGWVIYKEVQILLWEEERSRKREGRWGLRGDYSMFTSLSSFGLGFLALLFSLFLV
jgi:hypothetical protein